MEHPGHTCSRPTLTFLSRFYSLGAKSLQLSCSLLMLKDNVFVEMQDAALDVEFGFADVQNNTFLGLAGRPFANLRPRQTQVLTLPTRLIGNSHITRILARSKNRY